MVGIAVVALLLTGTNGSPLNIANGCMNDDVFRALESNRADALPFCRLYSGEITTTTQHAVCAGSRHLMDRTETLIELADDHNHPRGNHCDNDSECCTNHVGLLVPFLWTMLTLM